MESIRFSPRNVSNNLILCNAQAEKALRVRRKSFEERNKGSQAVIKMGIYGITASSDGILDHFAAY